MGTPSSVSLVDLALTPGSSGDAGGSDLGVPEALGVRVTAAQVTRAAWAALGGARVLTLVSQVLQLLRHPHVG